VTASQTPGSGSSDGPTGGSSDGPSATPSGHPSYTPTAGPSAGTDGSHGFAGSSAHVVGSGSDLVHVTEVAFDRFVAASVDGKALAAGQYEVRAGSIVVTLKAVYLDTLAVGTHELEVAFGDGVVADVFTIVPAGGGSSATPKPDPSVTYTTSPKPMPVTGSGVGPTAPLSLVFLGLGLTLIAAAGVVRRRLAPARRGL